LRRFATLGAAAALAVAAALALVPRPHASHDRIALRGSGLQVHRSRGGMPKLMEAGDRIRAGDTLSVVVTLPHPDPIDAWSIDANGRVDRLLQHGPLELAMGEHALPESAIVDAPCTDMWIVVGVGGTSNANVEASLKRLGPGRREAGDEWVPKGCLSRHLRCE
jgi:hypothetical protein